jgi:hypothetical protein
MRGISWLDEERLPFLIFVSTCIIDINNKEDKQLDATITVY